MRTLLAHLKTLLGAENVFDDRASIIALTAARANANKTPLPLAVLRPRHEGHIRELLHFCLENNFTLRIMGGGTSGLEQKARENEFLLLTGGLDRLLSLEEENRLLYAQSGISLSALEKRLAATSLFFPFQVSRTSPATLGGRIAANMPDLYSLAYGYPGQLLQEVEVFLASGEKSVLTCQNDQPLMPTLPVAHLFCGSRGLLGLISAVKIRLLPRPSASRSLFLTFPTEIEAIQASSSILATGLTPAALEILDRGAAAACKLDAQPCLYLSLSGPPPLLEDQLERLKRLFNSASLAPLSGQENDDFLSLYSVWQIRLQAAKPASLFTRLACPQDSLPSFILNLEEISQANNIEYAFSINAGLAYIKLLLFAANEKGLAHARKELFTLELMLNGKMASEGDAQLAPEAWREYHAEDMRLSRDLAAVFDPHRLFSASLF